MPTPTPHDILQRTEAECRRLDSQGWTLNLQLNIRSALALASTLALALHDPMTASWPSGEVSRAALLFIANQLGHSPFLRERVLASVPPPPTPGGAHAAN